MQRLCPHFPLTPRSHPIGTRGLAAGADATRAWERLSGSVRIWTPITTSSRCQHLPAAGTAGARWALVPGRAAVPRPAVQGGGGELPWHVRCSGIGCPWSVSPRLSPPVMSCSYVCARTGACGASRGILGGPGFGGGRVRAHSTARGLHGDDLRFSLPCCSGLGGGQPCEWVTPGDSPTRGCGRQPSAAQCHPGRYRVPFSRGNSIIKGAQAPG